MSNFFSELNNTVGKVKYQEFIIHLLDEEIIAYIPYSLKTEFFEKINSQQPETKKQIKMVVEQFSGKLG